MALTANFIADFSSFMDATREATDAMLGFRESTEGVGPAVDQAFEKRLKQYEQVATQVRQVGLEVVGVSKTFIAAFTEEQDAVARLTTALTANGAAVPEVLAQYSALATQFQNTTKYSDEAILSAQAVLTTIGEVGPDQMEQALTAVTNLASGMNIDLNTAATQVAKAFESGGESLGRLKTVLGDTIDPAKGAAGVLDAINDKFGGAAQSDLSTYNGQMQQLTNQFSDFEEQVGGTLVAMLTELLNAFRALPEPVQKFSIGLIAIGTALAPVLVSLSSLFSLLATTGVGAGLLSVFSSVLAFIGPAGWIVLAIAGLTALVVKNWDTIVAYTQKLYEGIKAWLVDGFDRIVGWVKDKIASITGAFSAMYNAVVGHSIVPDMITGIGQEFTKLDSVMVQPVKSATDAVIAHLQLMQFQMRANAILNRNSLFTTTSQLEEIAALPLPGGGGGRGGGTGNASPVTVNNTFNIVDTESNLARRVSDQIMQTIRAGTQLGTA